MVWMQIKDLIWYGLWIIRNGTLMLKLGLVSISYHNIRYINYQLNQKFYPEIYKLEFPVWDILSKDVYIPRGELGIFSEVFYKQFKDKKE